MKEFSLFTLIIENIRDQNISSIAQKLNLVENDFDKNFGLVNIDPETNNYCVMIDSNKIASIDSRYETIKGPFSNPRIEPFDIQE